VNCAIDTARASLLLAVLAALGEEGAFGERGDSKGERGIEEEASGDLEEYSDSG
jgi:hypothetical protein